MNRVFTRLPRLAEDDPLWLGIVEVQRARSSAWLTTPSATR
jgi:hypothetical protein